MLRTQIYLPESQINFLKKIAYQEDVSLSEAIRRLIEERLKKVKKIRPKLQNPGSWLLSLAKKAKKLRVKGPKDLASRVDFYLYGQKG